MGGIDRKASLFADIHQDEFSWALAKENQGKPASISLGVRRVRISMLLLLLQHRGIGAGFQQVAQNHKKAAIPLRQLVFTLFAWRQLHLLLKVLIHNSLQQS